jgi:hypothetical protein
MLNNEVILVNNLELRQDNHLAHLLDQGIDDRAQNGVKVD